MQWGTAVDDLVAPRAGAWIEIFFLILAFLSNSVAPRAGAWIEIRSYTSVFLVICLVAPRAGAWIEIFRFFKI